MVWRLQLILSGHLTTQGNHLSSNFTYIISYLLRLCMYRTKFTNLASKCGKIAKAKIPNVHI